jgi:uncharacterized protein YaiI (UPF0178 family)
MNIAKPNRILVDADACPNTIKDIIFRVAERLKIQVLLVANQPIAFPRSKFITMTQVGAGFNVADQHIVDIAIPGDLVITADIPLADWAITKGAYALNPRGEFYDKNNIKQKLSIRNFMDEVRSTGQITGGPAPLNNRDNQQFANSLDRFLAKNKKFFSA